MMDVTDLTIRGIKMLDIGYIAALYFLLAFGIAVVMDRILGPYDTLAAEKRSTARLLAEAVVHIWVSGVIIYIARNLVELVPFPLDGVYGFEHKRVKELTNGAVFTFIFLFFSYNLRKRLEYLYQRVTTTRV